MRDAISGLRPVISIDINPAMHPSLYSHTAAFGATESLTSPSRLPSRFSVDLKVVSNQLQLPLELEQPSHVYQRVPCRQHGPCG